MTSPSLSDLRYAYFGGGSDAEYDFLVNAKAAGITAQDFLEETIKSAMVKIAEINLNADAASMDIQGIPSDYRHLMFIADVRSSVAATFEFLTMFFNNDQTNANYANESRQAGGVTTITSESIEAAASRDVMLATGNTSNAFDFGTIRGIIPDYTSAIRTKTCLLTSGAAIARTTGNLLHSTKMLHWRKAPEPINRLTIASRAGSVVKAGSYISLYGLEFAA